MVFASIAAAAALGTEWSAAWSRALWVVVTIGVQLRLLANLFDGMVALESGETSAVGELFNEIPDRFSDVVVLVALGFVSGSSMHLGYLAAVLAVFVAYVRSMGSVAGAGQVFEGLMSKPRRMFIVTVICLFQAVAPSDWLAARDSQLGLGAVGWTLVVVVLGCAVTSVTRLRAIARLLRRKDD